MQHLFHCLNIPQSFFLSGKYSESTKKSILKSSCFGSNHLLVEIHNSQNTQQVWLFELPVHSTIIFGSKLPCCCIRKIESLTISIFIQICIFISGRIFFWFDTGNEFWNRNWPVLWGRRTTLLLVFEAWGTHRLIEESFLPFSGMFFIKLTWNFC